MPTLLRRRPTDPPFPVPVGTNDRILFPTGYGWGDPSRLKLTPHGDEFEYTSFAQMRRRWTMRGTTAADFDFEGDKVGWKAPGLHTGFYRPAPAGDIEIVLELNFGWGDGNAGMCIALLDAAGNGGAASMNSNNGEQTWGVSGYAIINNVSASAINIAWDGGHKWMAARRTGTTLQFRTSNDGQTWNAIGGGVAVAAGGVNLFLGTLHNSSFPAYTTLYRLNVYPGIFNG